MELPWLDKVTQAKAPKRLPVVLTVGETRAVLSQLTGAPVPALAVNGQPQGGVPLRR